MRSPKKGLGANMATKGVSASPVGSNERQLPRPFYIAPRWGTIENGRAVERRNRGAGEGKDKGEDASQVAGSARIRSTAVTCSPFKTYRAPKSLFVDLGIEPVQTLKADATQV